MKKKIIFGILFSAILAINIISVSKTDVSDLSLTSLMQTAKADYVEGGGSGTTCSGKDCDNNKDTGVNSGCCGVNDGFIGNKQ